MSSDYYGFGAAMELLFALVVFVVPIGLVTILTLIAALFIGAGWWIAAPILLAITFSAIWGYRWR